jgi:hypothetical protein
MRSLQRVQADEFFAALTVLQTEMQARVHARAHARTNECAHACTSAQTLEGILMVGAS